MGNRADMTKGRFFWKLFAGHAVLVGAALVLCVWLIVGRVDALYRTQLQSQMRTLAEALCEGVENRLDPAHADELSLLGRRVTEADPGGVRVTLIAADGRVLADTEGAPERMSDHLDRPEVRAAREQGWGESTRVSSTTRRETLYVARRVGPAKAPQGVVRVAIPISRIGQRTESLRNFIAITGAAVVLAAVLLWFGLARIWTRPLEDLTAVAQSLSRGDLSTPIAKPSTTDELGRLTLLLGRMRDRLSAQIQTIDRQRRTLESLLRQLHEGVIVADPRGAVVLVNPSAAAMLQLPRAGADGKDPLAGVPVERCIARHVLQEMLLPPARRTSAADEEPSGGVGYSEARLTVDSPNGTMHLLARASDIALPGDPRATEGEAVGRLLVLTNITELARTLQIKTDFVANASHELRTPLSTIRAAVETLLHMDLMEEPADAARFISVIDRHSARLTDMVTDLLDLARIESPAARFDPLPLRPRDIFDELRSRFAEPARAKGLRLAIDESGCDGRTILAHPHLLRLVVNNLVDNALKFTDAGGSVSVQARVNGEEATLWVEDTGCGIPDEEQERVFERFYQIERARSGPLRGTGLGLSIVRHAVAAMRGRVKLESAACRGTCVTITLPQQPSASHG